MIGIIGAMHIEVETVKSLMENKVSETVSGMEFVSGTLFGMRHRQGRRCNVRPDDDTQIFARMYHKHRRRR